MIGSGVQLVLECDGAVKPREKGLGLIGIERGVFQLDELIAVALEHDPLEAVRGDADETFALLAFAVGEIVRHPPDYVIPFLIEIPFCLENCPSDQSIEPAPHFGNATLEI